MRVLPPTAINPTSTNLMIPIRYSPLLLRSFIALAASFLVTLPSAAVDAGNRFAVQNVRVFDGQRSSPNMTVIIQNGRIDSISSDTEIPADLPIIDGTGRTLLPGFIDAHTHSWADAQRDALRFGVTAELDMLGDANRLPAIQRSREGLTRTAEDIT